MTNSGKHIRAVGCSTLNTVSVVNSSLARLSVDIKELQVVVEVHVAGTKVPTEQGSVSGEDGGNIEVALADKDEGDTGQPFVNVSDDGWGGVPVGVVELRGGDGAGVLLPICQLHGEIESSEFRCSKKMPSQTLPHLSQEPCNQVPKHNRLVRLMVIGR